MITSSSSPIFPTTHREHSVHPARLQAPSVDKWRHQESLWREDLQSGGNPRTTTPTGCEPKDLATVSRIEAYSGDPYQSYDVQEKVGEEDHRAPITEEVEEFREIGTAGLPDSKISENVPLPIADAFRRFRGKHSDLEDGELQKMLTSPLCAPMQLSCMREREESAQDTEADRKESLRSHASEGQKALVKLFSSEQGNLIRSSVFRNANPSNLRGSLIEGNKVHLLNQARSELAKQELHVESLNECIGEQQRPTEEQRLALQDAQYGFVECRREQVRIQEELSMKENVLRDTQIRKYARNGRIQRAQVLRADEVSVQKLRENHETNSAAHFPIAANARTDEFYE